MRRSSCAWDSSEVCRSNIVSRRQLPVWAEPESARPRLHGRARRRQFQTAQRAYASHIQYATQKTLDARTFTHRADRRRHANAGRAGWPSSPAATCKTADSTKRDKDRNRKRSRGEDGQVEWTCHSVLAQTSERV